jgi:ubiquinone/menaquinone biosynthesis C-methylase UbiE
MDERAYKEMSQMQQNHWWWRGMRRLYRATLQRFLPPSSAPRQIIEIGCGFGANLGVLAEFGSVAAVDMSLDALRSIREHQPNGKNMLLVQASADALPFKREAFDVVALLAVIEHVEDDARAMRESHRICRLKGFQILQTTAFMLLWSHHDVANEHYRRYLAHEIDAVQRSGGWKVLRTMYVNAFLFPAVAVVRLLQRWQEKRRANAKAQQTHTGGEAEGRYDMGPELGPLAVIPEHLLVAEAWWFNHTSLPLPFGVDVFTVSLRGEASATPPNTTG